MVIENARGTVAGSDYPELTRSLRSTDNTDDPTAVAGRVAAWCP